MQVCQRTHQGLVRTSNQDHLLVTEHIYGVADGMGGHQGGETASRVAAQVIQNALHGKEPDGTMLKQCVEAANRRVYDMAKHDNSLDGMGTTVTFLWEGKEQLWVAHVGDSRAYRLRDGELVQITQDHSIVAELVRNNAITPEMAKTHPYRNVITRAVGVDPMVTPDIIECDKKVGDRWLLCSDGLHNMLSDEEMTAILTEHEDEEAAEKLLSLALEHGGTDNVSFVLCRVTEVSAV